MLELFGMIYIIAEVHNLAMLCILFKWADVKWGKRATVFVIVFSAFPILNVVFPLFIYLILAWKGTVMYFNILKTVFISDAPDSYKGNFLKTYLEDEQ